MVDIIHGNDLNKKSLQDKDGNWRKCAICGGSASTGGAWLYAKPARQIWKTVEVWESHGQFDEGKAKQTGKVYTVQDRKDEAHVICVLRKMRHREVRQWKKRN